MTLRRRRADEGRFPGRCDVTGGGEVRHPRGRLPPARAADEAAGLLRVQGGVPAAARRPEVSLHRRPAHRQQGSWVLFVICLNCLILSRMLGFTKV